MKRMSACLLASIMILSTGCKTPTRRDIDADTSPPEIYQIEARYIRVQDGREVGREAIPVSGHVKRNISRDIKIVLDVVAADGQSGVTRIRLMQPEAIWDCLPQNMQVAQRKRATLQDLSDEERAGRASTDPFLIRTARFTLDPFEGNALRLVCASTDFASELKSSFAIAATNGRGQSTESGELTFVYVARPPSLPLATSDNCGNVFEGQVFECPAESICAARRMTLCRGWWIFKSCERIQTTDFFCQSRP